MILSTLIFYGVLGILTTYLAVKATSLKNRDLEKTTIDELTDRASWILGGLLLALIPLWWKWPIQNIIGAVLVPLIGIIITGSIAQLTLGTILESRSTPELVRKLVSLVVSYLIVFFIIRFILNLVF